jgi:hypothetical protein
MQTAHGVAATLSAAMRRPTSASSHDVRNPQSQTRTFWVDESKRRRLVTDVVGRSINVSLNCEV